MKLRVLISAALAGLAATALALVLSSGSSASGGYHLKLQMNDALGLRDGSKVVVGGVEIGRVKLGLGKDDRVVADLEIDGDHAPVGRDARAYVTSVNLLGQKSLELDPGDKRDPAPSGSVIPASRLTPATDLDQVLDVLDTGTRARLTVLINEAGAAFSGRRQDFSALLQELPHSLVHGTAMLDRLVGDHRTLADLVARSDRFVSSVTAERRQLGRLLDTVGRTAETFAARRAQLRETLRRLPATLTTARAFLDDLRRTTVPLGPAARDLRATATPLSSTLAQLEPFTKAATPALRQAVAVSPQLTRLADGATPTLRKAVPTLTALSQLTSDLAPVSQILMRSADNIVGTAANWAHAIQFRDALGHVFRAEVAITPQTLNALVDRLLSSQQRGKDRKKTSPPKPSLPKRATDPVKKLADPVKTVTSPVDKAVDDIKHVVQGVTQQLPGAGKSQGVKSLLDYLLEP
jgi:phospholipid/cholesterol/gamma-HCH transport system substrate-binding protein